MPDRDAGLQAERTRLAWRRTTLGTATVALLGVQRVAAGGVRPATVAAIAVIALALAAVLLLAHRRVRTLTEPWHGGRVVPPATRGAPMALALLVATVALVGTLLVL